MVGNTTIVDDEDERLVFGADGRFTASVVPKDQPGVWQSLEWPEELVMFYDPTDMFADLADALDEAYPQADGPAVVGDSQP